MKQIRNRDKEKDLKSILVLATRYIYFLIKKLGGGGGHLAGSLHRARLLNLRVVSSIPTLGMEPT